MKNTDKMERKIIEKLKSYKNSSYGLTVEEHKGMLFIDNKLVGFSPIEFVRFVSKYIESFETEEYQKYTELNIVSKEGYVRFEVTRDILENVVNQLEYSTVFQKLNEITWLTKSSYIYISRKKSGGISINTTLERNLPHWALERGITDIIKKGGDLNTVLNTPIVKIHRDCVELENGYKYSARFLNNMVDVYLDFKDSKKILTEHMVGYTINDLKKFTNPARIKFSGKQVGLKTFHRLLELNDEALTAATVSVLENFGLGFESPEMAFIIEKLGVSESIAYKIFDTQQWVKETLVFLYRDKNFSGLKTFVSKVTKAAEPYVAARLPLWVDPYYLLKTNDNYLVKEGKHTFAQIKKAIKKGFNSEYIEDLKRGGIEELFEAPWFDKISSLKVPDTSEYYSIGHIKTYALAKYAGLKFEDVDTTIISLSFEETEKIKKWSKKTKKVYFAPLERNSRLTAVQIKRLLMPGVIKDKFGARKTLQFWAVIKSTIGGLLDDFDETMRSFVITNSISKETTLFNQYVVQECNIQHIDIRVEGLHVYTMQHKDPKAINIGLYTNCCQYHGGVGHTCAMHSVSNPNGDVLVWRHNNRIIAQSWVWMHGEDTLVLDNVEFTNDVAHPKTVLKTMKKVLETLEYNNIFMGKQYNEMSPLIDVEIEAIPFSTPDGCYTDAEYGQWLKKDGEVLL